LLNREAIDFQAISVVCLDEADEMLKQGFQEDVEKIFDYIKKHTENKKPQTLLFSATIPDWLK
jgi:ATP-dependent RNA helicase DeaD